VWYDEFWGGGHPSTWSKQFFCYFWTSSSVFFRNRHCLSRIPFLPLIVIPKVYPIISSVVVVLFVLAGFCFLCEITSVFLAPKNVCNALVCTLGSPQWMHLIGWRRERHRSVWDTRACGRETEVKYIYSATATRQPLSRKDNKGRLCPVLTVRLPGKWTEQCRPCLTQVDWWRHSVSDVVEYVTTEKNY
jgi:hypothetical protein